MKHHNLPIFKQFHKPSTAQILQSSTKKNWHFDVHHLRIPEKDLQITFTSSVAITTYTLVKG